MLGAGRDDAQIGAGGDTTTAGIGQIPGGRVASGGLKGIGLYLADNPPGNVAYLDVHLRGCREGISYRHLLAVDLLGSYAGHQQTGLRLRCGGYLEMPHSALQPGIVSVAGSSTHIGGLVGVQVGQRQSVIIGQHTQVRIADSHFGIG